MKFHSYLRQVANYPSVATFLLDLHLLGLYRNAAFLPSCLYISLGNSNSITNANSVISHTGYLWILGKAAWI